MSEDSNNGYTVSRTGSSLCFRTANYAADRGSVLHSGIYNRELASALASGVLAGAVYTAFSYYAIRSYINYALTTLVFSSGFFVLRRFVFKGRYLEVLFDVPAGTAGIRMSGLVKTKVEDIPLGEIANLLIERKKAGIVNPDGVAFVEKISAQHGMVIPGFGEEAEFFVLTLKLTDGTSRVIYADKDMQCVISAHSEITGFLKIN